MSAPSTFLETLFSLQGKRALITGASGGIGRELAIGLAAAGAHVAVHGRNADQVEKSCAEVAAVGGRAIPLLADIGSVAECRRLVDEVIAGLGGLDILINCAATNRRMPIAEVQEDDYDQIMAVNLKSVYFLSQFAHAQMAAQGGGTLMTEPILVFRSAAAARRPSPASDVSRPRAARRPHLRGREHALLPTGDRHG